MEGFAHPIAGVNVMVDDARRLILACQLRMQGKNITWS